MTDYPVEYAGPSSRTMLLAMLCSITAVGVTLGITAPLFSVALDHMGFDSAMVGLNTSLGVAATLVTAPFVPRMLARLNPVPIMLGGILLSAGGLLAAGYLKSAALWFVLRFAIGIGMSLHWVISETYINQFSSEANRGFIAGIYSALFGLGLAIGPQILRATGVNGLLPFVISAALVLAAAFPLLWLRGGATAISHEHDALGMSVLRLAPVIMLASLISGFVDSTTLALLPVYGLDVGLRQGGALALLSVSTLGAVALQLPIGWIADRFGRRATLIGCALASLGTAAVLPLLIDTSWILYGVLFLWGGAVMAFYTLALTLLGSAFRGAALARASSALVIAYCLGSVIGPPLTGIAMDSFGANGFVAVMAFAAAVLVIAATLRISSARY